MRDPLGCWAGPMIVRRPSLRRAARPTFLFPVRALSEEFKAKFMQALHDAQAPVQAQPSKAARTAPAADG